MDFTLAPEIERTRRAIHEFVAAEILPLERDHANYDEGENIRLDVLERVRAKARAAGLWSLQSP